MLESTKRYDLLRSRLRSFTRTLPRLKSIDTRGAISAWVAVRRLRELLPLLQFNGASTSKLNAKLRRIVRRVELVRQSDARLALFDDLLARERRGRLAASRVRDNLEQHAKRARIERYRGVRFFAAPPAPPPPPAPARRTRPIGLPAPRRPRPTA